MNPQKALNQLLEGNARFVSGSLEHPNRSFKHRQMLIEKQSPFAAILSCSDSRTPPEILFDQGVGDLFTIRLAGNVASGAVVESLSYAINQLGVSVVVVMGHQNCGAIQAMLSGQLEGELASLIGPAVKGCAPDEDDKAGRAHVHHVVQLLKGCNLLAPVFKSEKIEIVGAFYRLDSGKIEILPG